MKKKILGFVLIAIMVFGLMGCGATYRNQCEKPTPLGVGWIAHLFYNSLCM